MAGSVKSAKKRIPLPLKRVRKELPPPGRIFRDRKRYSREEAKERFRRALKELPRPRESSSPRRKKETD